MQRWIAKVVALFVTFGVLFLCMALPTKVADFVHRQGERAGLIMSLLRCFAGGVFLGTIFLHMLPEVQEMVSESIMERYGIQYPMPEIVVLFGFFIICFFEKFVMAIHKKRQRQKAAKKNGIDQEAIVPPAQVMLTGHYPVLGPHDGTPSVMSEVIHEVQEDYFSDDVNGNIPNKCDEAETSKTVTDFTSFKTNGKVSVEMISKKEEGKIEELKMKEEKESQGIPQARSIILLLALSFECIFDGLGVGLQPTTGGVWNLFIAVVSHESIVSFCLGLELLKFHSKKKVLLAAFLYALIPPVGNVIGIAITETQNGTDSNTVTMVNGVLLGVAAGIFLYCTFIGMMGEELIENSTYKKILAILLGCCLMAGLAAVPEGPEEVQAEAATSYS